VVLELEPYRLISVYVADLGAIRPRNRSFVQRNRRFSMKLVTALSTAALVLVPAVGFAQNPESDARNEPGLVDKVMGTITGRSVDKKEDGAKSGDGDTAAQYPGDTNYPDQGAIKKTDK
jgi:hypothetical protein